MQKKKNKKKKNKPNNSLPFDETILYLCKELAKIQEKQMREIQKSNKRYYLSVKYKIEKIENMNKLLK